MALNAQKALYSVLGMSLIFMLICAVAALSRIPMYLFQTT